MRHIAHTAAMFFIFLGCLAPLALQASPRIIPPSISLTASRTLVQNIKDAGDLNPILVVEYPGGRFLQLSKRKWVEVGKRNKVAFTFELAGMDGKNFRLWDPSREVHIYIDLRGKQILYAPDGEDLRLLYPILGIMKPNEETDNPDVAEDQNVDEEEQPKARVLRYACTEGIPMAVRLVSREGKKFAFVSQDGGPEMRLKRISAPSGAKYSDGEYTLVTKGRNAVLERNGDLDICVGN